MIIIISILLILIIALGFIGNYFFNFALNTKVSKSGVLNANVGGKKNEKLEEDKKWYDETKKEVSINSVTGVKLNGNIFYANNNEKKENIETKNNKWIIVFHGYAGESRKMATYVRSFVNAGYNVLSPDLIAHGKSEENVISMGGFDGKDVASWAKLLNETEKAEKIGLFGISMGAATVLNSLDEQLPKNVCAYVADSGYLNLKRQFSYQLKKLYKLPSFPIIDSASLFAKIRGGYYLNDVDATAGLKQTNLPGLIMQGTNDGFVPFENLNNIEEILKNNNKKYRKEVFEGAKHCEAPNIYNERYWKIVLSFLNENM